MPSHTAKMHGEVDYLPMPNRALGGMDVCFCVGCHLSDMRSSDTHLDVI